MLIWFTLYSLRKSDDIKTADTIFVHSDKAYFYLRFLRKRSGINILALFRKFKTIFNLKYKICFRYIKIFFRQKNILRNYLKQLNFLTAVQQKPARPVWSRRWFLQRRRIRFVFWSCSFFRIFYLIYLHFLSQLQASTSSFNKSTNYQSH